MSHCKSNAIDKKNHSEKIIYCMICLLTMVENIFINRRIFKHLNAYEQRIII